MLPLGLQWVYAACLSTWPHLLQVEDILMLLHWASTAKAEGVPLDMPSSPTAEKRQELLRSFTLACLAAMQTGHGRLLSYTPASMPALQRYASRVLTAERTQVLADELRWLPPLLWDVRCHA